MIIREPINEIFKPDGTETVKEMTARYMRLLEDYTGGNIYKRNRVKWEREKLPTEAQAERLSEVELTNLAKEVLKKWRNGTGGMCGMQWGYFNLAWIKKRSGGKTRPNWRRGDNDRFDLLEQCLYGKSRSYGDIKKGTGVIELGKRNTGKSAGLGFAAATIINTEDVSNILMTSKGEKDGKDFLEDKVKFPMYKLPFYVRSTGNTDNRSILHVGEKTKNAYGHSIIYGRDSYFVTVAPSAEGVEGLGGRMWMHDEAPKTKDLKHLATNAFPALLNEYDEREGVAWITGVAGDFGKFGNDYIDMWDNAQAYELVRRFIPGWTSLEVDDYFNEDVEKAVHKILTKREEMFKVGETAGFGIMQQFPLTPEEALQNASVGVLPKGLIRKRRFYLNDHKKVYKQGDIEDNPVTGRTLFVPNQRGKIKLLEHPLSEKHLYCGFVDAYDIKTKGSLGSHGAMYILKRNTNLSPYERDIIAAKLEEEDDISERLKLHLKLGYMPVAQYIDDPDDPRIFARKAGKLMRHYGAMTAVEIRPSPIYMEMESNPDLFKLVQYNFVKVEKLNLSRANFGSKGQHIDNYWKTKRTGELQSYYFSYSDRIYFEELVSEKVERYDPEIQNRKIDEADALGGVLLHDKQPFLPTFNNQDDELAKPTFWGGGYISTSSGIIKNS